LRPQQACRLTSQSHRYTDRLQPFSHCLQRLLTCLRMLLNGGRIKILIQMRTLLSAFLIEVSDRQHGKCFQFGGLDSLPDWLQKESDGLWESTSANSSLTGTTECKVAIVLSSCQSTKIFATELARPETNRCCIYVNRYLRYIHRILCATNSFARLYSAFVE
jgi:hypothetical protein